MWIRERLEQFSQQADLWDSAQGTSAAYATAESALRQMRRGEATVNKIRLLLDPALPPITSNFPTEALGTVLRCLGILEDRDEWKVRLAPDAPALLADKLHP